MWNNCSELKVIEVNSNLPQPLFSKEGAFTDFLKYLECHAISFLAMTGMLCHCERSAVI
jgi:hypothetical protein